MEWESAMLRMRAPGIAAIRGRRLVLERQQVAHRQGVRDGNAYGRRCLRLWRCVGLRRQRLWSGGRHVARAPAKSSASHDRLQWRAGLPGVVTQGAGVGRAESMVRSYGMDLLRWFRLLDAAEVGWDRATRAEARDFSRWLQGGGRQYRGPRTGGAHAGKPAADAWTCWCSVVTGC
jgi:hypothetical protein